METKRLHKAIAEFGDMVVERAQKNLNTPGFGSQKANRKKNSTKKLSNSLGYQIRKQAQFGFIIDFNSGVDYAPIVEEGRDKGRMPPIAPIKEWIKNKPVRLQRNVKTEGIATKRFATKTDSAINSAAFAIAKSIAEKGIKPTPYFWDALEYVVDNMSEELEQALALDLEDFVADNFSKNKYITVR